MGANAEVTLSVRLRDSASAGLLKSLGMLEQETGKVAAGAGRAGSALDKMAAQGKQGATHIRAISSELDTATNKAGRVGTTLNRGLQTALGTAKGIGTALAQGVAGWETMKAVGGTIIKPTVDYESQLANMSNTAYAGKTIQEKQAGAKEMHEAIKSATAQYGGTREQGAAALDKILASGVFSDKDKGVQERARASGVSAEVQARKEAMSVLPSIMMGAKAANAQPEEVASFVLKGIQQGYFKPEEASAAVDKALAAAQAGGFEFKDMARHLGSQLAVGSTSGLNGMAGYERILAMNQAAFMAAGNGDEAGNNVLNVLQKLNSSDTKRDFKKQAGVDLDTELRKGALQGKDSLQVVLGLLSAQLGKDKGYQEAQAKLKTARDAKDEAGVAQALKSIELIAQGTAIGKFFQDRQALTGLIPMLDQAYMDGILERTKNAQGTAQENVDYLKTTTAYKNEQGDNVAANARYEAQLGAINTVVGGFNEGLAKMGTEFPALTGALLSLKDATVMAAAVYGSVSILGALAGKGGGGLLGKLLSAGKGSAALEAAEVAAGSAETIGAAGTSLAGTFGALSLAVAPLLAMGGVAAWAGKDDHSTEIGWATGFSDWLAKLMGRESLSPQDAASKARRDRGEISEDEYQRQRAQNRRNADRVSGSSALSSQYRGEGLASINQLNNVAQPSQELIQANAQLQQANAQLSQINQSANNDKLLGPLGQIQGGIAALNSKQWSFAATIPVYVDGHQVAQTVNTINGQQASRG